MSGAISEISGPARFSVDLIPPPPSHPVPLKEHGIFNIAQLHHDLTNEGNLSGYNNELKVGKLISLVSFVQEVRQVEPNDDWDRELVDLVVTMVDGYPIPEAYVQVKSSRSSVYDFFNSVGKRLNFDFPERNRSNGDDEYLRRRLWMRTNRFMVINAGEKKSGPVTDEYILNKFMREVEGIISDRI